MRKHLMFSLVTAGLIGSTATQAADDLKGMFDEGKVSGQIRAFHVDREYQGSSGASTHRDATAVGGHLKFETADYKGLSFGTALYTTNGLFLNSPRDDYSENDMTLLGKDNESYTILGEAYLQYKFDNTTFKAGRQKLNTPLAGADDARMLPNLFEAYVLTNKDIKDTTITVGHLTKFAQGTFGRVYNGGLLSATSGYSLTDSRDQVNKFVNMGTYATGKSTSGVTVASVVYTGIEGAKIQLWDYYAHDILNAIYGQVDYKVSYESIKPFVSAQFIKQNDVGDKILGDLDGMYVGLKAGAKVGNVTAYLAYSHTDDNSAAEAASGGTAKAIITPWGGMPAFTQGMVTRHMFLAGTKATKVVASYNLKDFGIKGSATAYYTSFDMDENSGYGISRTATEPGFDFKYYPKSVENLQLRFRGNFPRKFAESAAGHTGWSEYRFIVNYNF